MVLGFAVWITGLPSLGKSPASAADTIVRALEDKGYIARQPVSTTL
jgi:hypothetical protein